MNPKLVENHPELAAEIQHLTEKFGGGYDLYNGRGGAKFMEAMHLLAEHIVKNSTEVSIHIDHGSTGIQWVSVSATPRE